MATTTHRRFRAANVLDVRRFSTHDGDGIRTTVFLKGCSLACAWCQNPESIRARRSPVFFRSRCIDCGICLDRSLNGEAERNRDGEIVVNTNLRSDLWEDLVFHCPTGAIDFDSRTMSVDELVEEVQRDDVFFGRGGGVTISGGEPLFIPGFAAAVLEQLQANGIHTAIETALNVRLAYVQEAALFCDQIFADLKIFDPEDHRRWVGKPNDRILENLAWLLRSSHKEKVVVRTPMIPGITTGEDNIAAIAEFISGVDPDVKYELLNYNPLAAAKYDQVQDREFVFADDENPPVYSGGEMEQFREIARQHGVRNIVTG